MNTLIAITAALMLSTPNATVHSACTELAENSTNIYTKFNQIENKYAREWLLDSIREDDPKMADFIITLVSIKDDEYLLKDVYEACTTYRGNFRLMSQHLKLKYAGKRHG